ncbi:MAG: hypothetical protein JWO52_4239 [Gammaproteobacteria bacterium]|nr:hypothetical protein [Gammaproteobacteria bacterium]
MGLPGIHHKTIMPVIVRRLFLGCVVVALGAVVLVGATKVKQLAARGWGQYQEPAPAGPVELRVRELVLGNQPIETRFAGLFEYFSDGFARHATPGYSRVQYGGMRSRNSYAMDGLEGFARTAPLLAAWIYSGRDAAVGAAGGGRAGERLAMLRAGILGGVDPHSSEYWGDIRDRDQRIVEAADVARVLWLTRAGLWDRLNSLQKQMIRAWLLGGAGAQTPRSNWMLFPVVISLVLASLGPQNAPQELLQHAHQAFTDYKQYYQEHGWFYDPPYGADFYNAWGITYDLFWIHVVDPAFEPDFIVAALEKSADLTQHLISPQGIPIMGRSICYRTAVPVPLVAATLLDSGKFPVGRAVRGLDVVWRYFVANDSLRDGALTQGYFKADPRLLDVYSGTGSCQWGLRSLVLAFMHPAADRFWTATPEPLPVEETDYRLELAKLGWTVEGRRASGEVIITIPRNPADVNTIDEYSWTMQVRELFLRRPLRPSNHEIKYESRHYSSASPFPLEE